MTEPNYNLSEVAIQGGVIPPATVESARPFPGTFVVAVEGGVIASDPTNNVAANVKVTWTPAEEQSPATSAYVFVTTEPLPTGFNPPTPEQIYNQDGPFVDVQQISSSETATFEFTPQGSEVSYQLFAIAIV